MNQFHDGDILYHAGGAGDIWVVCGDVVKLIRNGTVLHEEYLHRVNRSWIGFKKIGEWKEKPNFP